ncbi:MAG: Rpn family recombination-promoting nuclease/putative transposase [Polyangiaceae bacterium]|nr:Rpn family recombination-promoting nuclease/putative transposase [Polyangiaceae bacterium]
MRELPLIVPLVLHHDEETWQSATSFHDLFPAELIGHPAWASVVPSFRFLLDDISRASDEELLARQMSMFARLALWLLRDARFGRLERTFEAWNELLARQYRSPDGPEATATLFCYIREVSEIGSVEALAEKLADPGLREVAMTSAEQLRQEGYDRGVREGLRRLRTAVLKQLRIKFGPLDEATQARVAAADDATLDRYAERVLSAATLAAVLED